MNLKIEECFFNCRDSVCGEEISIGDLGSVELMMWMSLVCTVRGVIRNGFMIKVASIREHKCDE